MKNDPNDDWAEVELIRWQTGGLPDASSPPLNIPLAITNIAENIESCVKDKDTKNMITPFNLVSVLRYLSKYQYD